MAMRTVFVNPKFTNPSRRKRGRKRSRRRNAMIANPRRRRSRGRRRNAGITPFVSNPLILSPNPRRRRRARNPLASLNLKSVVTRGLTYGGGAAIAVGANTLLLNGVSNFWMRNGARFAGAVGAALFLKGDLGAATAGGMFYPLMQEMASKVLGGTAASATEADLEGLAADLEDVMDDLDESDLSDDNDEMYVEDDEEDILS